MIIGECQCFGLLQKTNMWDKLLVTKSLHTRTQYLLSHKVCGVFRGLIDMTCLSVQTVLARYNVMIQSKLASCRS